MYLRSSHWNNYFRSNYNAEFEVSSSSTEEKSFKRDKRTGAGGGTAQMKLMSDTREAKRWRKKDGGDTMRIQINRTS